MSDTLIGCIKQSLAESTTKVYDAKQLSSEILSQTKDTILNNKYKINLVIIQANNDNASNLYINNKIKQCEHVGIKATHIKLDENITTQEMIKIINDLNAGSNITGILVQLPLYAHLNENKIVDSIKPSKDVDSLTAANLGKFYATGDNKYLPLTPLGIVEILKHNKINISGKKATVIGRSVISGKSMALALLNEDATVTICHSKTKNLKEICKNSDILITCIGKQMIDSSYVKDGAVVCNVGYDYVDGKTVGDIYLDDIINNSKASFVTKIFNTSGLMTTTMLVKRLLDMKMEE